MIKVAAELKDGGCVVNGSGAFRSADQPFGGYKKSGLGHEGGKYTFEEFTQLKTIIIKDVM
jgi:lactaldehyde dehydrogenase